MSHRLLSSAALAVVIASLVGCAVAPGQEPGQGQPTSKGLFGMIAAPPPPQPAPQPMFAAPVARAPAPAAQPAGSVADATLQRDVMKMIGTREGAAGGSPQPSLIAARGTGKAGATYVERWTINSNGMVVEYEVKLTPAAGGGVDYAVTRLKK